MLLFDSLLNYDDFFFSLPPPKLSSIDFSVLLVKSMLFTKSVLFYLENIDSIFIDAIFPLIFAMNYLSDI